MGIMSAREIKPILLEGVRQLDISQQSRDDLASILVPTGFLARDVALPRNIRLAVGPNEKVPDSAPEWIQIVHGTLQDPVREQIGKHIEIGKPEAQFRCGIAGKSETNY